MPGDEEHRHAGEAGAEGRRDLRPRAVGELDVGDERRRRGGQVEVARGRRPFRGADVPAERGEAAGEDLADFRIVLDEQDRLSRPTRPRDDRRRPARPDFGGAEVDREAGAAPRAALDGDHPRVPRDDAVDRGEAEPRAAPDRLRREERLEDPPDRLRRHADAGVLGGDDDPLAGEEADGAPRLVLAHLAPLGREDEAAAVGHRVPRVGGEVDQRLLELRAVGEHGAGAAAAQLEVDLLAEQRAQHPRGRGHQVVHVVRLALQRLAAAEEEQLPREPRAVPRGVEDLVHAGPRLRRRVDRDQLRAADDHLQHVVEFVRHAGREAAHRLQLAALLELLGQRALRGLVHADDDERRVVLAPHRADEHGEDARLAVLRPQVERRAVERRLAGEGVLQRVAERVLLVAEQRRPDVPRGAGLVASDAGQPLRGAVPEPHAAAPVDDGDERRRGLEHLLLEAEQLRLAFERRGQLGPRAAQVGDVAQDPLRRRAAVELDRRRRHLDVPRLAAARRREARPFAGDSARGEAAERLGGHAAGVVVVGRAEHPPRRAVEVDERAAAGDEDRVGERLEQPPVGLEDAGAAAGDDERDRQPGGEGEAGQRDRGDQRRAAPVGGHLDVEPLRADPLQRAAALELGERRVHRGLDVGARRVDRIGEPVVRQQPRRAPALGDGEAAGVAVADQGHGVDVVVEDGVDVPREQRLERPLGGDEADDLDVGPAAEAGAGLGLAGRPGLDADAPRAARRGAVGAHDEDQAGVEVGTREGDDAAARLDVVEGAGRDRRLAALDGAERLAERHRRELGRPTVRRADHAEDVGVEADVLAPLLVDERLEGRYSDLHDARRPPRGRRLGLPQGRRGDERERRQQRGAASAGDSDAPHVQSINTQIDVPAPRRA